MTDKLQHITAFKMLWPSPSLPWIIFYYGFLILIYGLCRRLSQEADEPPIILVK